MAAPEPSGDLAALRLDLINQGLRLDQGLLDAGFGLALALENINGPADGIDLILPGNWWTNVCVAPGYARTSPLTLGAGPGTALTLRHRSRGDLLVTLPDTARFRHQTTHSGVSCGDIGAVHGPWLVTAPFATRGDLQLDRPRRFLGLPPVRPLQKSRWSIDEVVACAEAAWRHAGARLVHLEAGHLLVDDGGVADLAPYITALKRALPTLVSVSVLPPADPLRTLDLYAAGCDAVSYHLLTWDEAEATRIAPVRQRFVPHARTLAALRAAARIFPRGAVSTDLLLGLEPLSQLTTAIDRLTADGIVPNLTVFRPLPGADEVPHGDLVATEPTLALMADRARLMHERDLWGSRVRGFPRTLAGNIPYQPALIDRLYANARRVLRVKLEAA